MWDALGLNVKTKWKNKQMTTQADIDAKQKKLSQMFSSVKRPTLIQVYQKFKFDYDAFGYDFNEVLKLAGYPLLTSQEKSYNPSFY